MTKFKHVMVKLKTMGIDPDSAIVSIGAVKFQPNYGGDISKDTFYRELEWATQSRKIDETTKHWWYEIKKKENRNVRKSDSKQKMHEALMGLDELKDVLCEFTEWLPEDCKIWANGSTFDIVLLENAYKQHGKAIPWRFWNIRDCRTLKEIYDSGRTNVEKNLGDPSGDALADAIKYTKSLNKMWQTLTRQSRT